MKDEIQITEITPKGEFALKLLVEGYSLEETTQIADATFKNNYERRELS